MKKFSLISFCIAATFAASSEFPEVIDFRNFPFFQDTLLNTNAESWNRALADSAFELGYTAFNDSPEIGTFLTLLQNDYHLEAAIETGTFLGATTHYLSLHYPEVYTVELSEPLYSAAKKKLEHRKNVVCHLGDSAETLKEILPSLKGKRLLFYLDAHGGGSYECPLLEELEQISKTHRDNCVIIIDDFKVPNTTINGATYNDGELSHAYIQLQLRKVLPNYTFHYLIPKQVSRSAKFVAIPKNWGKQLYWNAGKIDILSGFNIYDFPIRLNNVRDAGYKIQMQYQYPYGINNSPEDPDLKKIIVFGWTIDRRTLIDLPREKLLFFIMEPCEMPPGYYDYYPKVYTCNDDLVDNIKFFKLYYPYLMPMRTTLPSFEDKKFCVMVSGSDNEYPERKNELYSERMKMVEFFETKPAGEFDIYGRYWVKRHYRDFRGAIPGDHSGEEKISTLASYRFSICFENTKEIRGYITEKIFACFAAGCIPVYWGASNIETYIPKNAFIDYRDFKDKEELYQYMKTMSKATYEQYLENIRAFLNSDQAQIFSPAHFEQTFLEAISQ